MGVNEAAAVMTVIILANTSSGQKHFPGVDQRGNWKAHDHSGLVLALLVRSQIPTQTVLAHQIPLNRI